MHVPLESVGHPGTLALDHEEEQTADRRRTSEKNLKGRNSGQVKSGTLMLCKRNNVLSSLRDIPTPDYDSGAYLS